jgi:hypothetical protein
VSRDRLGPDPTAPAFHQLLDDGEADARASELAVAGLLHAIEALEEVRQV